MEFEYRLLTNREGPLAKCEVTDITQLNSYMEVLHGDFQLPGGEDSGLRWHTNPNRRIHVYERCSQFSFQYTDNHRAEMQKYETEESLLQYLKARFSTTEESVEICKLTK